MLDESKHYLAWPIQVAVLENIMWWKTSRGAVAMVLLCASALGSSASIYRFKLDPLASSVNAKVAFLGIGNQQANFPAVRGVVAISPDKMDQVNLDVSIDATQLKAGGDEITRRLKGKDFFYVEKYPTVRFEGTRLSMKNPTSGIVSGELTARGVTRPVVLNVSFSAPPSNTNGKDAIRLTAVTTINRKEFGMTAYSMVVGKKVTITIKTRLLPA